MTICPFCEQPDARHHLHFIGDSIHLHAHCSNKKIQKTRDLSNTDISTTLQHLGALFSHAPYPHSISLDPFRTLMCEILHQYDYHTQQDTSTPDPIQVTQLCQHTIMNPHNYRSITTRQSVWNEMRPDLTADSPDFRTYIHGLVFIIPHTNYIYTTMNVIDHIYIGILLRSANKTINRCSSAFVTQH